MANTAAPTTRRPHPQPTPPRAWDVRPDAFSAYGAGFELRTYRRCRRIFMFYRFPELGPAPVVVAAIELAHRDDPAGAPFLDDDKLHDILFVMAAYASSTTVVNML